MKIIINNLKKNWFLLLSVLILSSCQEKGPETKFSFQNNNCAPPCEISFQNDSKNAVTYKWNFGDGTTSDEQSPKKEYTVSGIYEVELIAINFNGEESYIDTVLIGGGGTGVFNNGAVETWKYSAGRSYPFSPRNHRYSFEITQNDSDVEIILESTELEVVVWLYNSLNERIGYKTGSAFSQTLNQTLDIGEYTIITGAYGRGKNGTYTLSVDGDIFNLQKEETMEIEEGSGEWENSTGGRSYPFSYRNHRYSFNVIENNAKIDMYIESSNADVALYLLSPLGEIEEYDYGGRNVFIIEDLDIGEYTAIAGTYARGEEGATYKLNIVGAVENLNKISYSTYSIDNGFWGTGGGGRNDPQSFRNDRYEFELTENNTVLDIILKSEDVDVCLWLLNSANEVVQRQYGDRKEEIIKDELSSGTYTIVAGTEFRNIGEASYSLSVVGQIDNFLQVESQDTIVTGDWANGGGYNDPYNSDHDIYSFELLESNSAVDIVLKSNDIDVCLWLFSENGTQIDKEYSDPTEFTVQNLQAGLYTIVAGTSNVGASGNYSISIVGEFDSFEKQ